MSLRLSDAEIASRAGGNPGVIRRMIFGRTATSSPAMIAGTVHQRHDDPPGDVLALAAADRLWLERLGPPVSSACGGRLTAGNKTPSPCVILAQLHHLVALNLSRRDFRPRRCFQFSGFLHSALEHPFP